MRPRSAGGSPARTRSSRSAISAPVSVEGWRTVVSSEGSLTAAVGPPGGGLGPAPARQPVDAGVHVQRPGDGAPVLPPGPEQVFGRPLTARDVVDVDERGLFDARDARFPPDTVGTSWLSSTGSRLPAW